MCNHVFDNENESDLQVLNDTHNMLHSKLKIYFNDEELLYLNRISFYMLTVHRAALSFPSFIECLTKMQDGNFEEKVDLVCEILKEGRQDFKIIRIDTVVSFFISSMPQDSHHIEVAEKHLRNLFI